MLVINIELDGENLVVGRTLLIFEAIVNLDRPLFLNSLLEEGLVVLSYSAQQELVLTEHNPVEIVFGDL